MCISIYEVINQNMLGRSEFSLQSQKITSCYLAPQHKQQKQEVDQDVHQDLLHYQYPAQYHSSGCTLFSGSSTSMLPGSVSWSKLTTAGCTHMGLRIYSFILEYGYNNICHCSNLQARPCWPLKVGPLNASMPAQASWLLFPSQIHLHKAYISQYLWSQNFQAPSTLQRMESRTEEHKREHGYG